MSSGCVLRLDTPKGITYVSITFYEGKYQEDSSWRFKFNIYLNK